MREAAIQLPNINSNADFKRCLVKTDHNRKISEEPIAALPNDSKPMPNGLIGQCADHNVPYVNPANTQNTTANTLILRALDFAACMEVSSFP